MFQVAIARNRSLPDFFPASPTFEAAVALADRYWREDMRTMLGRDGTLPASIRIRRNGDYVVVPAKGDREVMLSTEARAAALYTTAGHDWRAAFTAEELATWEAACLARRLEA